MLVPVLLAQAPRLPQQQLRDNVAAHRVLLQLARAEVRRRQQGPPWPHPRPPGARPLSLPNRQPALPEQLAPRALPPPLLQAPLQTPRGMRLHLRPRPQQAAVPPPQAAGGAGGSRAWAR